MCLTTLSNLRNLGSNSRTWCAPSLLTSNTFRTATYHCANLINITVLDLLSSYVPCYCSTVERISENHVTLTMVIYLLETGPWLDNIFPLQHTHLR
jgi:hypothetical protein